MKMLRIHNTARIFYFMNNNTDSDEGFYTNHNLHIEGYNGTNKSFSEIPLFVKWRNRNP